MQGNMKIASSSSPLPSLLNPQLCVVRGIKGRRRYCKRPFAYLCFFSTSFEMNRMLNVALLDTKGPNENTLKLFRKTIGVVSSRLGKTSSTVPNSHFRAGYQLRPKYTGVLFEVRENNQSSPATFVLCGLCDAITM